MRRLLSGRVLLNPSWAFAVVLLVFCSQGLAQPTLVYDPYEGIDWSSVQQLRTNLHTHTTQSDGALEPGVTIDKYHDQDYDILAITDHNVWTYPWTDFGRDPQKLGMIAVEGNELSRHHHTLGLFANLITPPMTGRWRWSRSAKLVALRSSAILRCTGSSTGI